MYQTFFCAADVDGVADREALLRQFRMRVDDRIQPSWDVLPDGLTAGAGGVLVSPTVVPISTIVAPASVRYFSAALEASVVPVVPNGSSQTDGM